MHSKLTVQVEEHLVADFNCVAGVTAVLINQLKQVNISACYYIFPLVYN